MNKIASPLDKAHRLALGAGTLVTVSLVAGTLVAGAFGASPAGAETSALTTSSATVSAAAAPTNFAPAASGTIASILGQTLEVQNPSTGQTTVDLTAKTAITATVSLSLRDVTKGSCISATGTKGKDGAVNATLVTIQPSVKGNCLERGGSASGGFRGGSGGSLPTRPSGTVPPRFRAPTNTAGAFGKVVSVSGSTIAIQGISFAGFGGRAPTSSTTKPAKTPKTGPVTVIVGSKTRYEESQRVNYRALKVGECATAFGSTNDIGVVTATRLSVTQPTGGSCTGGFGGFGGFGRGGSGTGALGASNGGPAGATS
jgi:hypothetical protein